MTDDLLVCLGWWLTRRDWRAVLSCSGSQRAGCRGSFSPSRTQFYFYAVAFVPFLVLSITLCLGLIIGPARASAGRRATGAALAGAYLLGVLWNFAYLYPVFAAKVIPYSQWLARMWYHGWIYAALPARLTAATGPAPGGWNPPTYRCG